MNFLNDTVGSLREQKSLKERELEADSQTVLDLPVTVRKVTPRDMAQSAIHAAAEFIDDGDDAEAKRYLNWAFTIMDAYRMDKVTGRKCIRLSGITAALKIMDENAIMYAGCSDEMELVIPVQDLDHAAMSCYDDELSKLSK